MNEKLREKVAETIFNRDYGIAELGSWAWQILAPGAKEKLCLFADQILQLCEEETRKQLRTALEQSRKGEPIDLSEEWFELFSAIQNNGISKAAEDHTSHLVDDVIHLEEELKVGNALTAKLTDQCRELEARLKEKHKEGSG